MGNFMASDLKPGIAESRANMSIWKRQGIFLRTFFLLSLFSVIIIGLYSSITIIRGRDALIMSLASEARSVSASISQVCADAVVSKDYGFIVEHSLEVLRSSSGILYIVVARKNGFTLVHTSKGWEMLENPAPEWLAGKNEETGGRLEYSPLMGQDIYRFSYPLQYSGLQWGWLRIGLSLEHLQTATQSMYKITALLGLLCVLGTIVGSYYFARYLTLPIFSLLKATRRITQGDLSTRAEITTKDEIGDLAKSFNQMTENLENTTFSKDYVDNIIQSMNESLMVMNTEGQIVMVNQAALDLLNVTSKEIFQKPLEEFVKKERTTHEKKWIEDIARKGVIANVEKNIYLKGGIKIPVLMSGSVMHDDKGEAQGFICLFMDNTQRKKAETSLKEAYEELKKTQAQLIQSGKLASIGELASGVAHELNQPLMVIRGMAQLIQRNFRKNHLNHDELMTQLDPIVRNSKRMMNIINHLRTFSRQAKEKFEPVDVNNTIEGSLLMVGEQLRLRNIDLKLELMEDLPKVSGNVNQLEQVILNLLTNARDAIEALGAGSKRIGVIKISTGISVEDGDWVEILVRDTGEGITGEDLKRIFEPFFTTKEVGDGTGLGLSISYGIIKDHHGTIDVAETGVGGTTFRLRLPVLALNKDTG